MNLFYKFFTFFRGFLIVIVPTLVVITIRLLLIKYAFDISDFINNFYTCSISLFLLNLIRFVIRTFMENFTVPIKLFFDNPNSLWEGSANPNILGGGNPNPNINPNPNANPNPNPNPNSDPPQNVGQPIF
jgi:hypothetical protein